MSDTGIVNLSLELTDVQDFVNAFKEMSAAATFAGGEVKKAVDDISSSLQNGIKEMRGLETVLKNITTGITSTNFGSLSEQIQKFKDLANVLGETAEKSNLFKGATVNIASSLDAGTLTAETQKLVDTLNNLQIPETVIDQAKQLKEALTGGVDEICKKMDKMIELLHGIQTNTSDTTQAIKNLGIVVKEADVQIENNNNTMKQQGGIVSSLIEKFKSLFYWRKKNNEAQQQGVNQRPQVSTTSATKESQGTLGMFNNKTIQEGMNYLRWTVKRVAYFALIDGFKNAFANVPKIGKQYEKITSTLSINFGGDIKLARAQFADLNDLINKIPQSLDEVVNVTKTLSNFNFSSSQKDLMSIAKIAEGTGESFEGIADMMGRFSEGSMNALKKIGITAKDSGDSIIMSFRGVDTEIQKNTVALQDYINSIAESQFGSALDEQMNGLTGTMKRLGNAWDDLSLALFQSGIGDAVKGFVEEGIGKLQNAIAWISNPRISKNIASIAQTITSAMSSMASLAQVVTGTFGAIVNGLGWVSKGVVTIFSGMLTFMSAGTIDFFNFWNTSLDDWLGSIQLVFEQINYAVKNMSDWFFGDEQQKKMSRNANKATEAIINEKGLDELKQRLQAKYPNGFIDKTFIMGDKTVLQNEANEVAKNIERIEKETNAALSRLQHTTNENVKNNLSSYVESLRKQKVELTGIQKQIIAVLQDDRYKASMGEFNVGPLTFGENAQKFANERLEQEKELKKKQEEQEEAIKKLVEGFKKPNGKPITPKGSGGGSGGSSELKNWKEFYKKQLAELTGYGQEKLRIESELTSTLKEIEETYQNADIKNVEQYNELKIKAQEKYNKDLADLLENQSNDVKRLFNKDYSNQLLDLEELLKERKDKIENALANTAITQEEYNQYMLLNEQKYQQELAKIKQEGYALFSLFDDSELLSLQSTYDKKLEMLEEFHNNSLISEEEFQQKRKEIIDKYYEEAEEKTISKREKEHEKWAKPYKEMSSALNELSSSFNGLAQNMDESSGAYKVLFAIQKSFAVASATMNAILAWTQALSDPSATTWQQKLANYASAIALTTNILSQLQSVSMFDKGGKIPAGEMGIVGEIGPELIRGPATVTSRRDTANLLNQKNSSDVVVNLIEDSSKAGQVEKRETDEQTIIDVCVSNIYRGGDIASAISNTYSLNRVGM